MKIWSAKAEDKEVKCIKKKTIQEKIMKQLGMRVDTVKQGQGKQKHCKIVY